MIKALLSLLINSTLLLLFIGLLALPSYVTGFLVINPSSLDLGSVAGVKTVTRDDFSVFPNLTDFNDYVSFDPQGLIEGRYQDKLTVTVFRNQIATYNTLYTIYNDSDHDLKFQLAIDEVPLTDSSFQKLIITLQSGQKAHQTRLLQEEKQGATLLEVASAETLRDSAQVIVGDEVVKVLARSGSSLVTTPLRQDHSAGESVYPEAVVVRRGELLLNQSQSIRLGPNQKATVNLVIVGDPNLGLSLRQIPLRLSIQAMPVK